MSSRPLSVRTVLAMHVVVLALGVGAVLFGAVIPAGLLGLGYAITLVVLFAHARRLAGATGEVAQLIGDSRYPEALAQLESLAARSRWIPDLHAVLLHRQASLHLATGAIDRAYELDRVAEDSGWFGIGVLAKRELPAVCAELAVLAALRDDTDEAKQWRAKVLDATATDPGGIKLFMDAVLLARRGEYADARDLIRGNAGAKSAPYRARIVSWILALSNARTGANDERVLAAARASTREALALANTWPELGKFVREHAAA